MHFYGGGGVGSRVVQLLLRPNCLLLNYQVEEIIRSVLNGNIEELGDQYKVVFAGLLLESAGK